MTKQFLHDPLKRNGLGNIHWLNTLFEKLSCFACTDKNHVKIESKQTRRSSRHKSKTTWNCSRFSTRFLSLKPQKLCFSPRNKRRVQANLPLHNLQMFLKVDQMHLQTCKISFLFQNKSSLNKSCDWINYLEAKHRELQQFNCTTWL